MRIIICSAILIAAVCLASAYEVPQPRTVAATQDLESLEVRKMTDLEHAKKENCKFLCSSCGCQGYYCGSECICQCNRADESNVRCLQSMKSRSQQLRYPFEVLIQGPAGRRFVREATDIDPQLLATYAENERNGRSVYSIYKPEAEGQGNLMTPEEMREAEAQSVDRVKREQQKKNLPTFSEIRERFAQQIANRRERVARAPVPDAPPAPADPTVGAPAPAPADPTVGAPAPADPTVGSSLPTTTLYPPFIAKLLKSAPSLKSLLPTPAPATSSLSDWVKKLNLPSSPIVGSPIIVQPAATQ